jgi:hypothetical protein
MAEKIKFKIIEEKFSEFTSKLEDLTLIADMLKLKIDNDNILVYSMLGGSTLLAFKSYLLNTKEYLLYDDDIDFTLDLVISNAKKFVKNLNFLNGNSKISMEVTYKQSADDDSIMNGRSVQIVGGKLKVNWLAGEHYELRDINKTVLAQRLDLKNKKWSFEIAKDDFRDLNKLSSINSSKLINISVIKGKVTMSEMAAWEMEIDQIDDKISTNLILNKKFLSCIDGEQETITFNIFETFMLIKDSESNLMLSFEQDFNED